MIFMKSEKIVRYSKRYEYPLPCLSKKKKNIYIYIYFFFVVLNQDWEVCVVFMI